VSDERAARALAALVDRPRDELFAGAALALDVDRRVGRCDLRDLLVQLDHRRACTDQRAATEHAARAGEPRVLAAAIAALERTRDRRAQLREVDRLGEVIGGAAADRIHRGARIGERGDEDDRRVGMAAVDRGEQLEAAGARHLDVGDHEVERRFAGAREAAQCLRTVGGERDRMAVAREHFGQHLATEIIVVDDERADRSHRWILPCAMLAPWLEEQCASAT
jgi:hypothetical protein